MSNIPYQKEEIEQKVLSLLNQGEKLSAVKLYIETYGGTLSDALDGISHLETRVFSSKNPQKFSSEKVKMLKEKFGDEIAMFILQNRRKDAVRLYRQKTGLPIWKVSEILQNAELAPALRPPRVPRPLQRPDSLEIQPKVKMLLRQGRREKASKLLYKKCGVLSEETNAVLAKLDKEILEERMLAAEKQQKASTPKKTSERVPRVSSSSSKKPRNKFFSVASRFLKTLFPFAETKE